MRILFLGDSITDMERNKEQDFAFNSYGSGYTFFIEGALNGENGRRHEIINRGICGNRSVDLYARIKSDCWNLQPDLISILIGVNDLWHEINYQNGVDLERFERIYEMIITDTKNKLPFVKFVIMEPFILKGEATEEKYQEFLAVKEYAKVIKKIAEKFDIPFIPLQEKFDTLAKEFGDKHLLYDGVHPSVSGASVIAKEWLKFFENFNK